MAGVFIMSLASIWLRTSLMHRAWPLLTIALALVLLVSDGYYPLVTLIFPVGMGGQRASADPKCG